MFVTGGGRCRPCADDRVASRWAGDFGAPHVSAETIVLADSITMRELETENRFVFDGSVEVMSGAMQMRSQTFTLLADKSC